MPVETAADRAALFDADEFGFPAQWSPADQWIPTDVIVHVHSPDFASPLGQVDLKGTTYRAKIRASDLPGDAKRGDRLFILDAAGAVVDRFKVVKPIEFDSTRQVALLQLQRIEV